MLVDIRNYKTIKHLKFEFDGFASIVGQNFVGKSGIVGAIVACLTNSVDKGAVRDGENFIEVSITRNDLNIHWHYEEGNTYYIINGQEYKKLNGAVPPPILEAGYGSIAVADEKVHLWYIEQFFPLFVVDKDRSNFATDLLASIFKFDSVYKALDMCRKELRDANSLVKSDNLSLLAAQDRLAPLLPLESIVPAVSDLHAQSELLIHLDAQLTKLELWSEILDNGKKDIAALMPVRNLQLCDLTEAEGLYNSFNRVSRLEESYRTAASSFVKLKPAGSLAVDPDINELSKMLSEYSKVDTFLDRISAAERTLAGLAGVKDLPTDLDVSGIQVSLDKLTRVTRLLSSYEDASKAYSALKGVPALGAVDSSVLDTVVALEKELATVSSFYSSLVLYAEEVKSAKAGLASLDSELNTALEQLSEFSSCPTCGKEIDAKEYAHAH